MNQNRSERQRQRRTRNRGWGHPVAPYHNDYTRMTKRGRRGLKRKRSAGHNHSRFRPQKLCDWCHRPFDSGQPRNTKRWAPQRGRYMHNDCYAAAFPPISMVGV